MSTPIARHHAAVTVPPVRLAAARSARGNPTQEGASVHRKLYFTATIITFDGCDTNAYGEACEPGHGYTERSGWWDPDRCY